MLIFILLLTMVHKVVTRFASSNMSANQPSSDGTIYFGFGSNLWLTQMAMRCPGSEYLGIARLPGFRWIINDRGYANVVQVSKREANHNQIDAVWGLVYRLTQDDEERLDVNEGVPVAYTKEMIPVHFWPSKGCSKAPFKGADEHKVDTSISYEKLTMLVYIDRQRTTDDKPKKEYIYRMNMGIQDALKVGVPDSYVQRVMRKFIPEDEKGEDETLKGFALKQALDFEDE